MSPPMPSHISEVFDVLSVSPRSGSGFDLGDWFSSFRDTLFSTANLDSAIIFGSFSFSWLVVCPASGSWLVDCPTPGSWLLDCPASGFGADLSSFFSSSSSFVINFPFVVHFGP